MGGEEVLATGVRCLIADRTAYGLSTLEIGTRSKEQDVAKTVPLSLRLYPDRYGANGKPFCDQREHGAIRKVPVFD